MKKEDYDYIESQIGYEFKNKDLLQQAFVRKTYSAENGGGDNEILEFIGDKALDIVIVRYLIKEYGYMASDCDDSDSSEEWEEFYCDEDEGGLTEIKSRLVCKNTLSRRIEMLGMEEYLIMGNGDINNNVMNSKSVKEDLFEAIIGAVTLDCDWDFETIRSVVELMLDPEEELANDSEENYVSMIYEWTEKNLHKQPDFIYRTGMKSTIIKLSVNTNDREKYQSYIPYHCSLDLGDGIGWFSASGDSKSEARKEVCRKVYQWLDNHDRLFSIRDEIENPNKDDAINQLETLARRGYFTIPEYVFEEDHDEDGNPIWICECHIDEYEDYYYAKSSSKKDAKKTAAFSMLEYVLE